MTQSIARQVIELEYKTAADLREIYNSIFPKKCAANASKDFLKPRIAYRLQEVTLGSLDEETVVKMEKVASGLSISNPQLHSDLLPGTKICREWNDPRSVITQNFLMTVIRPQPFIPKHSSYVFTS